SEQRARTLGAIDEIAPQGGTEFFEPLDMIHLDLVRAPTGRQHVVFITDGRASSEGLDELVNAMAKDAITLSTIGIGDSDAVLLEKLARIGRGRFRAATDLNTLPALVAEETADALRPH